MWNIPKDVEILKYFTGELKPYKENTKDNRRMFINEFTKEEQNKILDFFNKNKALILCDILKGRGKFSAEWMLVIQKVNDIKWVLIPMNKAINHYDGQVKISTRGSLNIGKILMQRKGGDAGRETANMLQFKVNPAELFNLEK